MSTDESFAERMARLRAGDSAVETEFFRQYVHRLLGLARRRLNDCARLKVEPDDVVNSALASFFTRHAKGEFDLQDEAGLWDKLLEITLRKCGKWNKRFRAQKRDPKAEVPIQPSADQSDPGFEPCDSDPTPEEAVILAEIVEYLMRDLDVREREVLKLLLQGYKVYEICEQVQLSERTVHRVLDRVRAQVGRGLDRLRAEDEVTG
jgi:RNA polymerase sigma factor (sigma-70 family)